MKTNFLLLLIFTLLSCSSNSSEKTTLNTMSILHNQPLYSIKIDTFGTKYILKINGVTILRETSSDGQLSTTIPVNHWMHPDRNTMEVHIVPPKKGGNFNPNARLEYSLILRSNADPDAFHILSTINLTGTSANSREFIHSSPSGIFDSFDQFKPDKKGDGYSGPIRSLILEHSDHLIWF